MGLRWNSSSKLKLKLQNRDYFRFTIFISWSSSLKISKLGKSKLD